MGLFVFGYWELEVEVDMVVATAVPVGEGGVVMI